MVTEVNDEEASTEVKTNNGMNVRKVKFCINLTFALIVVLSLGFIMWGPSHFFDDLLNHSNNNSGIPKETQKKAAPAPSPRGTQENISPEHRESAHLMERKKFFAQQGHPECATIYYRLITLLTRDETLPTELRPAFKDMRDTVTRISEHACKDLSNITPLKRLVEVLFPRLLGSLISQSDSDSLKLSWKAVQNDFEAVEVYMELFKDDKIVPIYGDDNFPAINDPEAQYMAVYKSQNLLSDMNEHLARASTHIGSHAIKLQLWYFIKYSLSLIGRIWLQPWDESCKKYKSSVLELTHKLSAIISEDLSLVQINLDELSELIAFRLNNPELIRALRIRVDAVTILESIAEYRACDSVEADQATKQACSDRLWAYLVSKLKRLANPIRAIVRERKVLSLHSIFSYQEVIEYITVNVHHFRHLGNHSQNKFLSLLSVVADDAVRLSKLGDLQIYFEPNEYVEDRGQQIDAYFDNADFGPAESKLQAEPTEKQLNGLFDLYLLLAKNKQLIRRLQKSSIVEETTQVTVTLQEIDRVNLPVLFPTVATRIERAIRRIRKAANECQEPNIDPVLLRDTLQQIDALLGEQLDWLQLHARGYPIDSKYISIRSSYIPDEIKSSSDKFSKRAQAPTLKRITFYLNNSFAAVIVMSLLSFVFIL